MHRWQELEVVPWAKCSSNKRQEVFELYWVSQFGTTLGHLKLGASCQIIIVLNNWKQISGIHE